MTEALDALTDKEKDTLRLIVRGHDAKSAASELDLSVHTINERLRQARRKLDVTSSREAARLLLESEEAPPESLAYKALGDAPPGAPDQSPATSRAPHSRGSKRWPPAAAWIAGVLIMSILTLVLGLALAGQHAPDATVDRDGQLAAVTAAASADHADAQRETVAREWLTLVDRSDWQASYEAAGQQFQQPNTVAGWQSASEQARVPLGQVIDRRAVEFQLINAPPSGYEIVRFLSDFEHREGVIETVTLERENGELRVVAYDID